MQITKIKNKWQGKTGILIAVLVAVVLGAILLGQYIAIGIFNSREAALRQELARIAELEKQYTMTPEELEAYLLELALEEGYGLPDAPYIVEE